MELHEKGKLTDPDLSLEWGDGETLVGLIERIAHRQGIGDLLAEGVAHIAKRIGQGTDRYAMHVKGMELPRQEPRFAKGFGLGHATSNRGADHLYALPNIDLAGAWDVARQIFPREILPELMDASNEKYKADIVIYGEHVCAVSDALGICKFSTAEAYTLLPDDLASGVAALTGAPLTGEELLTIGERIVNLERLFNVREGLSRSDDRLPRRFTEEAVPRYRFERDPVTGEMHPSDKPLDYGEIDDFNRMLDRYYHLRGWSQGGIPTLETLRRLDIEDYLMEEENDEP
jgi:aldehyde:ferredoxin oxidoreductase